MKYMKIVLILLFLLNINPLFANDDYLVTKENDTIYGKIEWNTHRSVFVINTDGKQKFKADKVNFFQRGAFRFVSIKIEFPEFLLEVINDDVSYYVEAHLKSKYAMNYVRKVYLKHKGKSYAIVVGANQKNSPTNSNLNPNSNVNIASSSVSYSFDFMEPFLKILGKESKLYSRIKKQNFSIDDVEYLVQLSNMELQNKPELNSSLIENIDKGFSKGYVILSNDNTINGSLKIKGGFLSKEKIIFRNNNGEEFEYEPKELLGFGINNRSYIIEEIKKKKVILKQNLKGKISLYRDVENRKSYLIKEGSEEYVLIDKKNKYLDLFKDNKEVYSRIVKNDYNRFEIKSIVKLYNE